MQKKKLLKTIMFVSAIILSALLFSGCSEQIEQFYLEKAGILENEDYKEYLSLKRDGKLNENNEYIGGSNSQIPEDKVRIIVGRNESCLFEDQSYYDVTPGDKLTLEASYVKHAASANYSLGGFEIYNFSGKEPEKIKDGWNVEIEGNKAVITVPEDCADKAFTLVPYGKFGTRIIMFKTECIDGADALDNSGWIVNNEQLSGQSLEVDALAPISVSYEYDDEKYVVKETYPHADREKGKVMFGDVAANEGIDEFKIVFRTVNGSFSFDPQKYKFEHGKIEFFYNGEPVGTPVDIPDGSKLKYKAFPDEGYVISPKEGFINVSTESDETTVMINDLKFFKDENVKVNLFQPDKGGTVRYFVDGNEITGESVGLKRGTEITLEGEPDFGWVTNNKAGGLVTSFKAGDNIESIVKNMFIEDEKKMPTMSLYFEDDSMKDSTVVVETADGKFEKNYTIDGEKTGISSIIPDFISIGSSSRRVFNEKVPTSKDIIISTPDTGRSRDSQVAVVDIVIEYEGGTEVRQRKYITKRTFEEHITVYDEEHPQEHLCEKITVNLKMLDDAVKVEEINAPANVQEVKLYMVLKDKSAVEIKAGDYISASEDVKVSIIPADGYYISGKNTQNGKYSDTMEYSDWLEDRDKIFEKHPVKKAITLNLDTKDLYGTVTFELDGKSVSGKVAVREDQELVLKYTVTKEGYKIKRSGIGGFIGSKVNKNNIEEELDFEDLTDNMTIRREDIIQVEGK